jgi:hypothetical protein
MPKRAASQPPKVETSSWWGIGVLKMAPEVVGFGTNLSQKNTLPIAIGQRPLMSFAIATIC